MAEWAQDKQLCMNTTQKGDCGAMHNGLDAVDVLHAGGSSGQSSCYGMFLMLHVDHVYLCRGILLLWGWGCMSLQFVGGRVSFLVLLAGLDAHDGHDRTVWTDRPLDKNEGQSVYCYWSATLHAGHTWLLIGLAFDVRDLDGRNIP